MYPRAMTCKHILWHWVCPVQQVLSKLIMGLKKKVSKALCLGVTLKCFLWVVGFLPWEVSLAVLSTPPDYKELPWVLVKSVATAHSHHE